MDLRKYITIPILMISLGTSAQVYRADRPQFAISGHVLPVKTFSVEAGLAAEFVTADMQAFVHPEWNVRIGMMKLMEMSFGFSIPGQFGPVDEDGEKDYTTGFASPKIGVKITMREKEEGKRLAMAFMGQAGLNFGSKEFRDTKILPAFRISMDVDWSDRTNMRVNYGVVWLENRSLIDPEGNPVIDPFIIVALDVSNRVTDKLTVFGEFFARVKHNNFRSGYYLSGGLIVHLKENVSLDVSGGAGLSPESSRGFAQVGFSGLWPKRNAVASENLN